MDGAGVRQGEPENEIAGLCGWRAVDRGGAGRAWGAAPGRAAGGNIDDDGEEGSAGLFEGGVRHRAALQEPGRGARQETDAGRGEGDPGQWHRTRVLRAP